MTAFFAGAVVGSIIGTMTMSLLVGGTREQEHAGLWLEHQLREADRLNGELREENERLRGLARFIMHQCNEGNPRCDECIDRNGGECVALLRMRELEVTE